MSKKIKADNKVISKTAKKEEPIFSPAQLGNTLDFVLVKDIISIVADKDKGYTKAEMQKLVDDFLNKEVD